MNIEELIIRHEGLKLKPYLDTVGKLTIGVGRNLDDFGITENEARYLLENDLGRVRDELDRYFPWWRSLDDVRQMVLIDMCFNLGIARFCAFSRFLTHMQAGEWDDAAREMEDSLWWGQVGTRAKRLQTMVRTGTMPEEGPA